MSDAHEVMALVAKAPEVIAAHAVLDEVERLEEAASRDLGRAIRQAIPHAEAHLAECDPWVEPCGFCGRKPRDHVDR